MKELAYGRLDLIVQYQVSAKISDLHLLRIEETKDQVALTMSPGPAIAAAISSPRLPSAGSLAVTAHHTRRSSLSRPNIVPRRTRAISVASSRKPVATADRKA